jgi:hypothetical protein
MPRFRGFEGAFRNSGVYLLQDIFHIYGRFLKKIYQLVACISNGMKCTRHSVVWASLLPGKSHTSHFSAPITSVQHVKGLILTWF